MSVKPIPEGYHTITPYLIANEVKKLIDFLKAAFDAEIIFKSENPDGSVRHAEIKIGDSMLMMGAAGDSYPAMPCSMYLYVSDTDEVYKKAMNAGAESMMEPADQFYGDRNAGVKDFSGNIWWIGTHIEDVSEEEMKKREEEFGKNK